MKRENIDGKPIFKDKIWNQMCFVGNKLINLGYIESGKKPNLFYKQINCKNNKQGLIFGDIRGAKQLPIWEDPRPSLYFQDLTYGLFVKELIFLKRNKCPIKTFPKSNWLFFNTIPNGYCRNCKVDILDRIDWEELLSWHEEMVPRVELHYCENCKKKEYDEKRKKDQERKRREKLKIICRLCGKVDNNIIKHHITYDPPEIIKVCRPCHGFIHACTFPNGLWEQKIPAKKEKEVQFCNICNDFHVKDSVIAKMHIILGRFQEVIKFRSKVMNYNLNLKQRRVYNKQALQTEKEINSLLGELSPSAQKKVTKMMDNFDFTKKGAKNKKIINFL